MSNIFFTQKNSNHTNFQLAKLLVVTNLFLFLITGFKYAETGTTSLTNNAASALDLTKSVSNTTPLSGENFFYTLQYSCAGLTEDCLGTVITDPLPAEVEFVSVLGSVHTDSESYDAATHTVTFTFIDPLVSGSTGEVRIEVRFPNGITPNGTTASNTASINASNAPEEFSANVITTASAVDRMATRKFYGGAVLDNEMIFGFQVCNNDHQASVENGTISPSSITVRDTLPVNATFISSDNGIYDAASHSIVWTYPGTLALGECWWPEVTVQFSSSDYSVGGTEINTGYITYTPVGGSPTTNEESVTITFEAPNSQGNLIKGVNNITSRQGQSNFYTIQYWNASNIYTDGFYLEDLIPDGIIVDNFNIGQFYANGTYTNLEKTIKYITNLNSTWTTTSGSPYALSDNSTINSIDLGLVANEHITGIRWEFGPDPMPYSSGFSSSVPVYINFHVDANAPLGNITNCLTGGGVDSTFTIRNASSTPECATFEVLAGSSGFIPETRKDYLGKACGCWTYFGTGDFFNPGDTISFRIKVGNYNVSTTNIVDPAMADLLPIGLTYLGGTWSMDNYGTGAPAPNFSIQNNHNGTGRELLTWDWSGFSLAPGETVDIMFDAILELDAPAGENALVNEYAMLQNGGEGCAPGGYEKADIDDLDNDGDTAENLCFSFVELDVGSVISVESEKLVRGQLDTAYTKYPDVANSVPGGISDYILEIRNTGNVPMDSIVIIDIFPTVGDIGVVDITARDSRWQPNLVSTIDAPAGVVVYYSTEDNPCRDSEGLEPTGPVGCAAPNWSIAPPTDLTTVRSVKFEFGSTLLQQQDTIQLSWPMRVPVNVFSTIGAQPDSIAWNSFGFIGRRTDNGSYSLASEPVKVGIDVNGVVPNVYGDFVWEDTNQNGIQNGGEPGIDGIRVELFRDNGDGIPNPSSDTFINFTLTGNGGYYLFPNLPDGDYYAVFYKSPTMEITINDVGGDDNNDSDGVAGTYNGFDVAINPIVTLDNFAYDLSWDLGLYSSTNGAVGDYVWNDANGNGIQDEANSEGINGVTIYLYDNSSPSSPIDSVVTSNDVNGNPGYYLFSEIPVGNYFLELNLPSGVNYTSQGAMGTSDPSDSDFNVGTNRTEVFAVIAGNYDNSWDGGLMLSGTEVCDNGIDDDGDGLADCLDPDCPCYNPFVCESDIYMAYSTSFSQPSTFSKFNTTTNPFTLDVIGNVTYNVNAMGYRNQDDFIYGVELGTNELIRIGADGIGYNLGEILGLPMPVTSSDVYDSGDVFPDGYLYIHEVSFHREIYQIDVTTSPPQLVAIHSLDQSIYLSDFAYNILDDKLYGIGDNGRKYMIDPSDWSVTTIGTSAPSASYGAAFTDDLGRVFIYNNNVGALYLVDFGINGTGTGDMTLIANAPQVYLNDGASCRGTIMIPEICGNGIDDDGDGNTDCDDTECGVSVIEYDNDQAACGVVGQDNFIASTSGASDVKFNAPMSIAVDENTGKLFLAEYGNHRVLRFASVDDFINGNAAEAVLGQVNFTANSSGTTQSTMDGPTGIVVDNNGTLWVVEHFNARVTRFDNASTLANGANADGVLGQPNFTTDVEAIGQANMRRPTFAVIENDGTLWVSDRDNSRVLRFDNAATLPNGANASGVLGQPDFNTDLPGGTIATTSSANGIVIIENALYMGSYVNNRILIWENAKNKPNGADADRVLGQSDFTTTSYSISQSSVDFPFALSADKDNNLYVTDIIANRVLVFMDAPSKANGANADKVLGQPNFTTSSPGTSANKMSSPAQTTVFESNTRTYLALADYGNNRILLYNQYYKTDELTAISDTLNGVDLSGGGITNFTLLSQPAFGSITLDDPTTGAFTYTPAGNCPLDVDTMLQFTYSVENGNGCIDSTTVDLKILDVQPCVEICDNGIDDDLNGLTDCEETICIPIANPALLAVCDNSNMTGSGTFFLHDANPTVSTESGVVVSYHPSGLDAQNATNILISPYTSGDVTVYARVERLSSGCFSTSEITLDVGAKCLENCNNGIDDDGDGLIDCDDPDCPCCKSYAPILDELNKKEP